MGIPASWLVLLSVMAATMSSVVIGGQRSRHEAVLPPVALLALLLAGYVVGDDLRRAAAETAPVASLVLGFAAVATGFQHCGLFRWFAAFALRYSNGKGSRLQWLLFTLTSLLTYFVSNDVAVLAMTPAVLAICRRAGAYDTRLLLLGQFAAANTTAMGMLTGSPTNYIVARGLGLGFVAYWHLMTLPALLATLASFPAVAAVSALCSRILGWERMTSVAGDSRAVLPAFTRAMAGWALGGTTYVAGAALATQYGISLCWVGMPTIALARLALSQSADAGGRIAALRQTTVSLPWEIVPFALACFAVASALGRSLPALTVDGLPDVIAGLAVLVSSAALANLVNDLPAALLTADWLQATASGNEVSPLLTRCVLAALNVGCCLLPSGSLAGVAWFRVMAPATDLRTPSRREMAVFGLGYFALSATALALTLPLLPQSAPLSHG